MKNILILEKNIIKKDDINFLQKHHQIDFISLDKCKIKLLDACNKHKPEIIILITKSLLNRKSHEYTYLNKLMYKNKFKLIELAKEKSNLENIKSNSNAVINGSEDVLLLILKKILNKQNYIFNEN